MPTVGTDGKLDEQKALVQKRDQELVKKKEEIIKLTKEKQEITTRSN
jgi:hypothetical protein